MIDCYCAFLSCACCDRELYINHSAFGSFGVCHRVGRANHYTIRNILVEYTNMYVVIVDVFNIVLDIRQPRRIKMGGLIPARDHQ